MSDARGNYRGPSKEFLEGYSDSYDNHPYYGRNRVSKPAPDRRPAKLKLIRTCITMFSGAAGLLFVALGWYRDDTTLLAVIALLGSLACVVMGMSGVRKYLKQQKRVLS